MAWAENKHCSQRCVHRDHNLLNEQWGHRTSHNGDGQMHSTTSQSELQSGNVLSGKGSIVGLQGCWAHATVLGLFGDVGGKEWGNPNTSISVIPCCPSKFQGRIIRKTTRRKRPILLHWGIWERVEMGILSRNVLSFKSGRNWVLWNANHPKSNTPLVHFFEETFIVHSFKRNLGAILPWTSDPARRWRVSMRRGKETW